MKIEIVSASIVFAIISGYVMQKEYGYENMGYSHLIVYILVNIVVGVFVFLYFEKSQKK